MTAQVCAPLVGTSVSTLFKMAEKGLLPVLRTGLTGRSLRFIPSEVIAALRARPAWVDPAKHRRGVRKTESEGDNENTKAKTAEEAANFPGGEYKEL